jgi:ATP-dependent DNA helicase RecQ
MSIDLERILKKYFGFSKFKHGQKDVITSILKGQHTLAMLPTGAGKSLCYQLPGYLMDGQVIIVSPLLSLMQDQVEQMVIRGEKRVIAINSFLSREEKKEIFERLESYKFIFVSPEMLTIESVLRKFQQIKISLFVVDEAHCISQWGYDFRPDYMKIGKIRTALGNPLTLALTATATDAVIVDILSSLHLHEWKKYVFSVDRPNISMSVELLAGLKEKQKRVLELISYLQGPGIIYFSSKKLADEMAQMIKAQGFSNVASYHGGMEQESRVLIQQQFIHEQLDCICATSAFGMGINKENVRYVIHFHMPLQPESYLQEIGRAGRDSKDSIAILLYSPGDELLSYQLIENELPNETQLERLFSWLMDGKRSYQDLERFEEEIRDYTGFTDIQWRIVTEYFHGLDDSERSMEQSFEELTLYIQKRVELKKEKINEMKKWIQFNECRREKILKYFGEQKKIKSAACCDICGIDLKRYKKNISVNKDSNSPFQWKEYLSTILLNKRA